MNTFKYTVIGLGILGGMALQGNGYGQETGSPEGSKPEQSLPSRYTGNVTAQSQGGTMIYTIASRSGIGSASIAPRKGWAKKVVLRANLRGLESLAVSNGKVTLKVSVLSHSENRRLLSLKDGDGEKQIGQDSPYWTTVRVFDAKGKPIDGLPGEGGYFEMELPPVLLDGQPKSLTIDWIDFYRR